MSAPDIRHGHRAHAGILPSWSGHDGFVNAEHADIWRATSHIAGWQEEGDTAKLYEMGHFAGDVILEIGTYAGRSSLALLRGSLAAGRRPRFFGVDIHVTAIADTFATLHDAGVSEHAYLHLGTLQDFAQATPVTPTMVFLDGDHRYPGVKKDLDALAELLPPGVPVLCHDYTSTETDGVRRGCDEWEAAGGAVFHGVFGCSALYVTASGCRGRAIPPMSDVEFYRKSRQILGECLEASHLESQSVHLYCQRQLTLAGRDCQEQLNRLTRTVREQLAEKDRRIAQLETPGGALKSLAKAGLRALGARR